METSQSSITPDLLCFVTVDLIKLDLDNHSIEFNDPKPVLSIKICRYFQFME